MQATLDKSICQINKYEAHEKDDWSDDCLEDKDGFQCGVRGFGGCFYPQKKH